MRLLKSFTILLMFTGLASAGVYDMSITTQPGRTLAVQFTLEGNPGAALDPATVPVTVNGTQLLLTTNYATNQPIVTFPSGGTESVLVDTSAMSGADFLQMTVHDASKLAVNQPSILAAAGATADEAPALISTSPFDPTVQLTSAVVPEPYPWLILLTCGLLAICWRKRKAA